MRITIKNDIHPKKSIYEQFAYLPNLPTSSDMNELCAIDRIERKIMEVET